MSWSRGVFACLGPPIVFGLVALVCCMRPRMPALGNRATTPAASGDRTAASVIPAGGWSIEAAGGGKARIKYSNATVGTLQYLFWGKNWSWADSQAKVLAPENGTERFVVEVPSLGVTIRGQFRKGAGELAIEYAVESRQRFSDIVGGGIEFNLQLGSPLFARENTAVDLLPSNRGFAWRIGDQKVVVSMDRPIPSVLFERDRHDQVRFFLLGKSLEPGRFTRTLTIHLPDGGVVRPSVAERYGADGGPDFMTGTLSWDKWPVDVSWLNDGDRPAGRHGRLRVEGERLVFEDGTVGRFFGTNLMGYALFNGTHAAIANQAKRIAALGYNLVRIHHHDSDWVDPNIFKKGSTTNELDDRSLESLDWWIKCLEEQGVYLWIDLHVGRHFLEGDGIAAYPEIAKEKGMGKGFNFVDPRIEKLMQRFAEQYLSRVSRHTGRALKDDPAVAGILLTNENDLTVHFGSLLLPTADNPVHQKMFETEARAIAAAKGLPLPQSLNTWEPGPAKIVLNEIEQRFYRRAIDRLRAIGVTAPIATSSYWGEEPLFSLPSLAVGDVVDVHSYGEPEALSQNPRYEPNFVSWIGAAQVAGKALSISEWNVEYPKRDRFTAPLYLAAVASLQRWTAPMLFGYLQGPATEPDRADSWSTAYDPALTALIPAAAVLFRRGDVAPARRTYCFAPSRDDLYGRELTPKTSATLRTLVEQSRLVVALPDIPELDWDRFPSCPADASVVTTPDRDFIPAGQNEVRSDTGELARDWVTGTQTIDTPMSQAAAGWIGSHLIRTRDAEFHIDTPKATVSLTSLDARSIGASRRILLTVVGQVAAGSDDALPWRAQPVLGTIALHSSERGLTMWPLSPTAHPAGAGPDRERTGLPVAPKREGDRLIFQLPSRPFTHWFIIQPLDGENGSPRAK